MKAHLGKIWGDLVYNDWHSGVSERMLAVFESGTIIFSPQI